MKSIAILIFLIAPVTLLGQKNKEILELQRDVAQMQDQMRVLQRSLDEKMAVISELLKQNADKADRVQTSIAILERSVNDRFKEQQKELSVPVATVGTKVDALTNEYQGLRGAVEDINSRTSKMQTKLGDMERLIQSLPDIIRQQLTPPTPAPVAAPVTQGGAAAPGGAATPPQGLSAEQLYNAAMGDRLGGKSDLALSEFSDYLRYFGKTDIAPNAQYYIGEIYYSKADYDNALKAFDTVLNAYGDTAKTPDAMFMKGKTLVKMDQRSDAVKVFRDLRKKFPNTDVAGKAATELKNLGLPVSAAPASKKRRQ